MFSKQVTYKRLFVYIAIFLFYVYGVWNAFGIFLNRQIFTSNYVNVMCSNHVPSDTSIIPANHDVRQQNNEICDAPKKIQFKKFLWFLTDGLPIRYSEPTLNHYKDHSVLFTIDIPGPKYSHAIYTRYKIYIIINIKLFNRTITYKL